MRRLAGTTRRKRRLGLLEPVVRDRREDGRPGGKHAFAPASGDVWNHAQALAAQSGRLVLLGGYHATTASVNLAWLARLEVYLIFGDDFDAGHLGLWSNVAP